ncbi:MAG: TolC family protein [Candidatus Lambdaproteobacteria bacterium]|nr:TolC family protein [Candidatus Lambdaproteobacteria bacterium]
MNLTARRPIAGRGAAGPAGPASTPREGCGTAPFLKALARLAVTVTILALALVSTGSPLAAQPAGQPTPGVLAEPPGATLESLLRLVRAGNPEVRMAAEEAQAAAARTRSAGVLADPTLTLRSDENMVASGAVLPDQSGNLTLSIQQAFPLGGRLALARQVAQADARQADRQRLGMEQEVAMRVKMAYAEHFLAIRALALMGEIRATLLHLATIAESRYAQALGAQQDVLFLRVETAMMEADIRRMEAERAGVRVRLNSLLARAPEAPLADARELRPLPAESALAPPALYERARRNNPGLAAQTARVESAQTSQELARRIYWPELMLGFGVMSPRDGSRSYEAMVGINLPLRWEARDAQIAEATAMSAAARFRRDAADLQLQAELGEALAALEAQRAVGMTLGGAAVPQSEAAFRTLVSAYEVGRGESIAILEATRRVWQAQLDLLRARVEADKQLTVVERIIGEDL